MGHTMEQEIGHRPERVARALGGMSRDEKARAARLWGGGATPSTGRGQQGCREVGPLHQWSDGGEAARRWSIQLPQGQLVAQIMAQKLAPLIFKKIENFGIKMVANLICHTNFGNNYVEKL